VPGLLDSKLAKRLDEVRLEGSHWWCPPGVNMGVSSIHHITSVHSQI